MKIKTFAAGVSIAVGMGLGAVASAGVVSADPGNDDIWLPGDHRGRTPSVRRGR